nr:YkgJ family cysteine cluster protein [Alienimonas californiensis]
MVNDEPWYANGLRFSCTACGACCTGAPGAIWVDDEEQAAIAEAAGISLMELRLKRTRLIGGRVSLRERANGDCTFLDPNTRKCTVYAARPVQCRTWPFWDSNLNTPADWERTKAECPGAGVGQLVSLQDIRRQANQRSL